MSQLSSYVVHGYIGDYPEQNNYALFRAKCEFSWLRLNVGTSKLKADSRIRSPAQIWNLLHAKWGILLIVGIYIILQFVCEFLQKYSCYQQFCITFGFSVIKNGTSWLVGKCTGLQIWWPKVLLLDAWGRRTGVFFWGGRVSILPNQHLCTLISVCLTSMYKTHTKITGTLTFFPMHCTHLAGTKNSALATGRWQALCHSWMHCTWCATLAHTNSTAELLTVRGPSRSAYLTDLTLHWWQCHLQANNICPQPRPATAGGPVTSTVGTELGHGFSTREVLHPPTKL